MIRLNSLEFDAVRSSGKARVVHLRDPAVQGDYDPPTCGYELVGRYRWLKIDWIEGQLVNLSQHDRRKLCPKCVKKALKRAGAQLPFAYNQWRKGGER